MEYVQESMQVIPEVTMCFHGEWETFYVLFSNFSQYLRYMNGIIPLSGASMDIFARWNEYSFHLSTHIDRTNSPPVRISCYSESKKFDVAGMSFDCVLTARVVSAAKSCIGCVLVCFHASYLLQMDLSTMQPSSAIENMLENATEDGMENRTFIPQDTIAEPQLVPLDTFIGLILAFSSCLFIGISVIFKKLALRDIEVSDEVKYNLLTEEYKAIVSAHTVTKWSD